MLGCEFNSVALLCSEKLAAIGLKISVFRLQQKTLNNLVDWN